RAAGPAGRVTSYELRDEFARIAEQNIRRYLGATDALVLRRADIYAGVLPDDRPVDRLILDVPEPWRVVRHAAAALVPGGIFLCYVPTVPQVTQAVEALRTSGAFAMIETIEVLVRPWNIDGLSVRPAHRMVAHTGFLTTARRVQRQAASGSRPHPNQGPRRRLWDDRRSTECELRHQSNSVGGPCGGRHSRTRPITKDARNGVSLSYLGIKKCGRAPGKVPHVKQEVPFGRVI